jgi:hypothetical protein
MIKHFAVHTRRVTVMVSPPNPPKLEATGKKGTGLKFKCISKLDDAAQDVIRFLQKRQSKKR